jgi:peroxin-13
MNIGPYDARAPVPGLGVASAPALPARGPPPAPGAAPSSVPPLPPRPGQAPRLLPPGPLPSQQQAMLRSSNVLLLPASSTLPRPSYGYGSSFPSSYGYGRGYAGGGGYGAVGGYGAAGGGYGAGDSPMDNRFVVDTTAPTDHNLPDSSRWRRRAACRPSRQSAAWSRWDAMPSLPLSSAQAFGSISMMLESTFHAVHSSFQVITAQLHPCK